jgi:hypothetical protein
MINYKEIMLFRHVQDKALEQNVKASIQKILLNISITNEYVYN